MILKRLVEVINRKNKLRYNLFNNNYLIFYEFFCNFFYIYILIKNVPIIKNLQVLTMYTFDIARTVRLFSRSMLTCYYSSKIDYRKVDYRDYSITGFRSLTMIGNILPSNNISKNIDLRLRL